MIGFQMTSTPELLRAIADAYPMTWSVMADPKDEDTSSADESLVGDTSDLPDDVRDGDVAEGEDE